MMRWLFFRGVGLLSLLLVATVYGPAQSRPCSDWPVSGGMRACPHAAPLNATSVRSRATERLAVAQGWTCFAAGRWGVVCVPPKSRHA